MIGEEINVSVLGIRGRQVRLGFEAPREVAIHREEIAIKIAQKKKK